MIQREEQRARLDAIAGMAERFRARAAEYDREAAFPAENFAELRRAGLLSLTVPEENGGHGLWWGDRYGEYYEVLEALARIDSSTAQLVQVHSHATGFISRRATDAQRAGVLRRIVDDGLLVASVGSETNPRSTRPGDYTAELSPDGDGWRLTCSKFFASLSPAADYLLMWVAVPGDRPYPERTVTVLVPREAPQVRLIDQWDVMGMRPTVSWSVDIEDLPVAPDAVFGAPGSWVTDDPRTFTLGFTANHVGAAQGAFDLTCDWVRERPYLAGSDLTQHMLGEMSSELFAARSALYAAAAVWEGGDHDQAELESIKALHLAKRVLLDTTRRAFDVCGARVAFRMFPIEMMYRDARTFTLHFRDELTMRELGRAEIEGRFSAKRALDSSEMPSRNA
ncbi:MAG TPA: acyl-CoA dehydrogenase family protein [Gaiellales bacterium]|jgi:alkylation response protein AidB-like acyl-CoA dehydrogenase|nr:acyl-CoA dehydrogenase family protein [Gaiellales bacterium]